MSSYLLNLPVELARSWCLCGSTQMEIDRICRAQKFREIQTFG
jgi:hypothetical protein